MRPNGTIPTNGAELNGKAPNGSSEPTIAEVLAFLRGTLGETRETDVAVAASITLAERGDKHKPEPFTAALVKAEAMAEAAATASAAQPKPEPRAQEPPAAAPETTPLKPVQMPFKDSRFMRLSAASAPLPEIVAEASVVHPAETHAPAEALSSLASLRQPASQPQQQPAAQPWPAAMHGSKPAASPHWTAAAMGKAASNTNFGADARPPTPLAMQPPPVPANAPAVIDAEFNTVESTAAELLRPVLRQWLTDNMPRIVEKALRIELAEGPAPKRE